MIAPLGSRAAVTVVLAHRDCTWGLGRAIRSILEQTLDAVALVVVDDDSADRAAVQAVLDRCADPRLTALRSTRNVGQFRIYSRLLPAIDSPLIAYQDADDWSRPERLQTLAEAVERDGWDVLGSALARRERGGGALPTLTPPLDVNRACAWRCRGGALFGATTMCRTAFVRRLGGYDGMTRFGADTDFAYRALFAGRVGNLPQPLYEATVRADSLTAAPGTGFGSPARRRYVRSISRRFYANRLRRAVGPVPLERLQAAPCDVEFDLVPLDA